MKNFKSSFSRLAKYFENSRNKWKKKAADRHKQIRALNIKIRDLEKSRDNWKKKAKKDNNSTSINTSKKSRKILKNKQDQDNTPSKKVEKTKLNQKDSLSKDNNYAEKTVKIEKNQNDIPSNKHNIHINEAIKTKQNQDIILINKNEKKEICITENHQKIIYLPNSYMPDWNFISFFYIFFLYYQYVRHQYSFLHENNQDNNILINKNKMLKDKEEKEIRILKVKVCNLRRSRDKWKREAKENRVLCKPIKRKLIQIPKGHTYSTQIILNSLEMLVNIHISLRGTNKVLQLLKPQLQGLGQLTHKVPAYTSVYNWSYRMGLYLLNRPIERRDDWIIIIDHTGQSGKEKASVILGISLEKLKKVGYSPSHRNMQLIDIKVFTSSTGEIIYETLEEISSKIGNIIQIVTDHGSDIKKGVRLFVEAHPNTIGTYDVSHYVATLLKKELSKDERWLTFLSQCSQARRQVLQTELSFLKPPIQRTKARFMHTEEHLKWAEEKINYDKKGDFSAINPVFILDLEVHNIIKEQLGKSSEIKTSLIQDKHFQGLDEFYQALIEQLGQSQVDKLDEKVFQKADLGRRRWNEKFSWLSEYEEDIKLYNSMIKRTKLTQIHLKKKGIAQGSKAEIKKCFTQFFSTEPRVQQVEKEILQYVKNEEKNIPKNTTLLASSDIIESTFGKYKELTKNSPIKEVGKRLLLIPIFLTELSTKLVNKAMEKVQNTDVDKWAKETCGESMLSKCRKAFKNIMPKIT